MGPRNTERTRAADHPIDPLMPLVAIKNYETKGRNDERWDTWFELQYLTREKARLERSAQIARDREAERRATAEKQKKHIASAQTVVEQRQAVDETNSIDVSAPESGYEAAIRWAQRGNTNADTDQEFDQAIDPETFVSPGIRAAPNQKIRVKRRPPRGLGQRVRG